jgi:2-haloacid dehalogenase
VKRYSIVFIDLDDTLLDFAAAERDALAGVFADFSLALSPEAARVYEEKNTALWKALERGEIDQGRLKVERFRQCFDELGWSVDAAAVSAAYIARLGRSAILLPHAQESCAYLAAKYRLALITNGIADVQHPRIKASPFAQLIELVVVSEEAGCGKPDPAIFGYACERLGFFDKAAMIMVGDSLASDVQGASNFGIDSCWLNRSAKGRPAGSPAPSYEIRSIEEITTIL